MTAWLMVVAPMCLLAKCGVDFITLEYGNRFQFISDSHLFWCCITMCIYALIVDFINFKKGKQ